MKPKKGSLLILIGLLLIAAAFSIIGYNLWEEHRASQSANSVVIHLESAAPDTQLLSEPEIPDHILNPNMEMPTEQINGRDFIGVLEIPSLGLELPVVSQWSYPALKVAPCRYDGSAYTDNLIIAAHNYKSHFAKLKNLELGETVIFTDVDANTFTYEAASKETLAPTDIEEMKSGDWDLTLFTCTYAGQHRITVRCERES